MCCWNIVEGDDAQFPTPIAQNIIGEQPGEVAADPPSEGGIGSTRCDVTGRLDSGSRTVNQSSVNESLVARDIDKDMEGTVTCCSWCYLLLPTSIRWPFVSTSSGQLRAQEILLRDLTQI